MTATSEDYTWNFDPDRSDGGVTVNDVNVDMPEYKPGKTGDLELLFWALEGEADIDAGAQASGSGGFQVSSASGATVGSIWRETAHVSRYKSVREYTFYAGRYHLNLTLDGTPQITDKTPSGASVDSVIVELVPGEALPDTPGLWVAVRDVTDATRFIQDMARITLRVDFLARGSEYASRSALKNDIGGDL